MASRIEGHGWLFLYLLFCKEGRKAWAFVRAFFSRVSELFFFLRCSLLCCVYWFCYGGCVLLDGGKFDDVECAEAVLVVRPSPVRVAHRRQPRLAGGLEATSMDERPKRVVMMRASTKSWLVFCCVFFFFRMVR